jgi:hypothetical protein
MNKALLKSIMTLHGDTVSDLAHYLCLTPQSVYYKMNETKMASGKKAEFGQGEIRRIKERYNLDPEQVEAVFFS